MLMAIPLALVHGPLMEFLSTEEQQKAIGRRIALARRALDLKQVTVAERVGVSPQRWNNYETGRRPLDTMAAIRFSNLYGVPLDFIYRDDWTKLPHEIAAYIERNRSPQQ